MSIYSYQQNVQGMPDANLPREERERKAFWREAKAEAECPEPYKRARVFADRSAANPLRCVRKGNIVYILDEQHTPPTPQRTTHDAELERTLSGAFNNKAIQMRQRLGGE